MLRLFCSALALLSFGCQLPSEQPPVASPPPPPAAREPAALPPEETAPVEEPAPPPTQEERPVEPGITRTGAPTRGTLPPAVVQEKLEAAQPAIVACYQRALVEQPGLRGNLSINFVVAPDGKVAHAEATQVEDELKDEATVGCILAEIKKLEFPQPKGGRALLNYPLQLQPPSSPPPQSPDPAR